MATQVILVRHGRSNYNQMGLFQGSLDDSYLTEQGIETAKKTGDYLAQFQIDQSFVSPLKRARQTFDLLRSTHPQLPTAQVLPDLREIDLPEWQGLPYKQVRQDQQQAYHCWKETPNEFQMVHQRGESETCFFPVQELFNRAQSLWQQLIPQCSEQTFLIVSHGGTIQALIATALGLPASIFHRMQQSNCGISILNFPEGLAAPAKLQVLNYTQHLNEALPKLKEGKKGTRELLFVTPDYPLKCDCPAASSSSDIAELTVAADRHLAKRLMEYAQIQKFPGLITLLRCVSIQTAWQHLQKALGPRLQPSSIDGADRFLCVLHHPLSVNHTIIQEITSLSTLKLP